MLDQILQFDQQLFHLINGEWHHALLDTLLPWWREKNSWIPFYLLLAGFALYKFRLRGLYFILGAILSVGLADGVSSQGFKKNVQRLRPCQNTEVQAEVRLLAGCGRSYSFTSSHAANHFAMATFIALTLGRLYRWMRIPLWLWAALVAYGQVYVGVHYPLDVLAGAFIGWLIGFVIAKVYLRQDKLRLQLE